MMLYIRENPSFEDEGIFFIILGEKKHILLPVLFVHQRC